MPLLDGHPEGSADAFEAWMKSPLEEKLITLGIFLAIIVVGNLVAQGIGWIARKGKKDPPQ